MIKRIEWIDTAKGILIILVVLGHCRTNRIVDMVINSFHMVAFFSLSGITFNANRPFGEFLRKKSKSLIVPYLVFSAYFLLYQYAKTFVFPGARFNIVSGLISIVIPISGRNSTSVYGLWYFPCLFLAEVAYYAVLKLRSKTVMGAIILFIALSAFCVWSNQAFGVVSIVGILPFSVASLALGKILWEWSAQIRKKRGVVFVSSLILFAVTVGLNYIFFSHSIDLSSLTLGCVPLYLMSSVSGTILIYTIAVALPAQRILQFFGKDSMYYYGLHYEVIGVIEKILPGGGLQTMGTFAILIPIVVCYKTMRFRRGKND